MIAQAANGLQFNCDHHNQERGENHQAFFHAHGKGSAIVERSTNSGLKEGGGTCS